MTNSTLGRVGKMHKTHDKYNRTVIYSVVHQVNVNLANVTCYSLILSGATSAVQLAGSDWPHMNAYKGTNPGRQAAQSAVFMFRAVSLSCRLAGGDISTAKEVPSKLNNRQLELRPRFCMAYGILAACFHNAASIHTICRPGISNRYPDPNPNN